MTGKTPKKLRERLSRKLAEIRRRSGPPRPSVSDPLGLRDGTFWRRLLEPKSLPEPQTSWEPAVFRRWIFLSEARRLHPEILEELETEVFRQARGDDRDRALLAWQESFCLTEPWIHGEASLTLMWWEGWENRNGTVPRRWHFELDMVDQRNQRRDQGMSWIEGTYSYPLPNLSWTPHEESGEASIQRCREQLQRVADDFAQRVRGIEQHSAYRRARREAEGRLHHYRWLIAKQVQGCTYADIAEHSGFNEDTVGRAVRDLAKDLGLTRRDDRRGRPLGRKDSGPRISPTRW